MLKELRPKGKVEPPKDWPFEVSDPKNLGKEAGLGAIQQVVYVQDKPTLGMGSGSVFLSSNIRRNLGHLAERLDKAIEGRDDLILISKDFDFPPRRK